MPKSSRVAIAVFRHFRSHPGGYGGLQVNREETHDDRAPCKRDIQSCGLPEAILPSVPEPYLGAHVVTPRRGYFHHGIYVGGDKVVHYAGFVCGLRRGPVEEVPFDHFTRGRPSSVIPTEPKFARQEVVERARSRLGEDCYRLWTNNCEHFCEWCLHGEHRSLQVERWMQSAGILRRMGAALAIH
jgi:hypothetical protein